MAEPVKKDEALAAAVREAFQRHMENARVAAQALKEKQAQAQSSRQSNSAQTARDSRLKVPEAANQRDVTPASRAPGTPGGSAAPASESAAVNPSLGRLVALASPQKANETAPSETGIQSTSIAGSGSDASQSQKEPAEKEHPLDFGEALFNEIARELDWKTPETTPRMPKAASLESAVDAIEADKEEISDDLTAKKTGMRARFGLVSTVSVEESPAVTQPAAPQSKPPAKNSVLPLPPPTRRTSRFGVTPPAAAEVKQRPNKIAPARPVNANDALFAAKARSTSRVRIPAALLASVVLGAAIIALASYFWAYPDKLRSLGMLVAPPAPPSSDTNVAESKPAAPVAPTKTAQQPASGAASLSHSVTTVAIKVDEVDQAIQNAHELVAAGNIQEARSVLDTYKTGNDPRALFALAETYDPAVIHDSKLADAAQAKTFYEAAAKAGSQDNTADRIARLQVDRVN